MENMTKSMILLVPIILLSSSGICSQSGGTFSIEKSVISNGGGQCVGGSITVDGTIAEPVAGKLSTGGAFELGSGFWGIGAAAASSGMISGRVTTPSGQSLRNAVVSMIDASGIRRTATTSSFGLYSFDNVAFGQNYTVTVSSKRFRFAPRFLAITESLAGIDFVGLE